MQATDPLVAILEEYRIDDEPAYVIAEVNGRLLVTPRAYPEETPVAIVNNSSGYTICYEQYSAEYPTPELTATAVHLTLLRSGSSLVDGPYVYRCLQIPRIGAQPCTEQEK